MVHKSFWIILQFGEFRFAPMMPNSTNAQRWSPFLYSCFLFSLLFCPSNARSVRPPCLVGYDTAAENCAAAVPGAETYRISITFPGRRCQPTCWFSRSAGGSVMQIMRSSVKTKHSYHTVPSQTTAWAAQATRRKSKNQGKWVHAMAGLKTKGSYYEVIQTASALPGDELNPLNRSVDCLLRVYQRIVRTYQLQNELLLLRDFSPWR
jgi:hypothetical protein